MDMRNILLSPQRTHFRPYVADCNPWQRHVRLHVSDWKDEVVDSMVFFSNNQTLWQEGLEISRDDV